MSRNIIAGVVILVLAVAYWFGADAIPKSRLGGTVGADGLPKVFAVTLAILSVLLIVQSVLLPKGEGAATAPSPEEAAERRRQHLRAAGMLAIGVGYVLLVEWLGYFLSVALLITAVALYNGRKPTLGMAVLVVAAAVFFYVLFVRVLSVPLPPGFWPELLRAVG